MQMINNERYWRVLIVIYTQSPMDLITGHISSFHDVNRICSTNVFILTSVAFAQLICKILPFGKYVGQVVQISMNYRKK